MIRSEGRVPPKSPPSMGIWTSRGRRPAPKEGSKVLATAPPPTGVFWPNPGSSHGNVDETRVLLLSLNWWRPKDPRTPLGTAYLYAWLRSRLRKEEQVRIGFVDHHVTEDCALSVAEVLSVDPKVLGIGVYVWNCQEVREVTRALRARGFQGMIVLGGAEVSYGEAELLEEYPDADYFVKGEGEAAFEEIVRSVLDLNSAFGYPLRSAMSPPGSPEEPAAMTG